MMASATVKNGRISLDEPNLQGNERKYLNQCIDTNWISWQGEFVGKTEELIARYCGTKHGLTVVNGTSALIMALQALDIGPGDEVIVPALTMSATAFAVTTVGATVVWVDSTKDTFLMSPEDIQKKITPKTKAVMVVHLYGHAADMQSIKAVVDPKGIPIIEDVAEGFGASIGESKVGGMGTIGCHSFHNKIIASGEGGAITLNDDNLFARLKALRTPPPDNSGSEMITLNHRMSNVAAAVAFAQLERIEELVEKRKHVAKLYDEILSAIDAVTVFPERENTRCVYWRYQVSLHEGYPLSKEDLIKKLKANNIESRAIFTLMSDHPQYKPLCRDVFPNSSEVSGCSLDIPSSPNLTDDQIQRITDIITNPQKN